MIKILITFFIIFLFSGCGGSNDLSDNDKNITVEDNNSSTMNIDKNISMQKSKEPYYYQQWYLECNQSFCKKNNIDFNASINAKNLISQYTGKNITIAIIDDGLDVNHEEFNNSIIETFNIEGNSSNVSEPSLSSYHGTAVTGIIAANINHKGIRGIAPDAKIIFLKMKENMSDSETIELFKKAQKMGADIINCSWGTYNVSPAVKDVIIDLAKNGRDGKGIVIVFSCGNDERDIENDESNIAKVISVGSTDIDNKRAWYSNYGDNLDILAPGGYYVGITTTDPMGENGIACNDSNYILANDENSFAGTSASAPIVSGIIALMLEANPNLTRDEIEKILHNNSDKLGDFEYINSFNKYYGYGKLNALKIYNYFVKKKNYK